MPEHVDQLIAAVAADDMLGIHPDIAGECGVKCGGVRIGVEIVTWKVAQGACYSRRRWVGALITVELDEPIHRNASARAERIK